MDFRYRNRRVRKRSHEQTKRGAEAHERLLRRQFIEDDEAGRDPFAGPPPTLAEFTERFFREYVETNNRPASIYSKHKAFDAHLIPAFGALRLDEVTTARVDAFKAEKRGAGLSPKTVNNVLSMLRCCLATAAEWGILRSVPRFKWLKVPSAGYRYLSYEEAEALIVASPPGYWRTLVIFLLRTGCRFGEAAALGWEDLELNRAVPMVHIRRAASRGVIGPTKTGRPRDIPLASDIAAEFRSFMHDGDYVFQLRDGRVPKPDCTIDYLHHFCDRAGIKRISWHVLRHTFATELTGRGVPLRAVQELLGHSTIQMTCRYAHVAPSALESAISLLSIPPEQTLQRQRGHLMATKRPRGHDRPPIVRSQCERNMAETTEKPALQAGLSDSFSW